MTRILIPRGPNCSSKVVSSTDFELYFCPILPTYAECGWCVTDPCMGLAACVAAGTARFLGLHINNTATCQVSCLTACSTNHIYVQVTRVGCIASSWAFTTNVTGVTPALSFKIGTATTDCAQVTAVNTCIVPRNIVIGSACPSFQIMPYDQCICNYTTPDCAVSTSNADLSIQCPCFTDCFCCDNWNDNPNCTSLVEVNTCTNVLDFCAPISLARSHGSSVALQACPISQTAWVLRFKFSLDCSFCPNGDGTGQFVIVSVTDSDSCELSLASQCGVTFGIASASNTSPYYLTGSQCEALIGPSRNDFCCQPEAGACQTLFVEMSRTSTTNFVTKIYSDACFQCETDSMCNAISACITGLRFMKVMILNGDATITGSITGTVDCVEFWCGINSFDADRTIDGSVTTRWQSMCEANPAIYVDMMCCVDALGISIHPHSNNTVVTAKIRASTDATFTDSETIRTITWSDMTDCTYNFIRFNRLPEDRQFYQIISDDACNAVMAINEIEVITETTAAIAREHGHLRINVDDTSLALDGT